MNDILDKIETCINIQIGCSEINKICFIIIITSICSTIVLLANFSLKKLFEIDLFKITTNNFLNPLFWVVGCTSTYLILYSLKIISYNLQSIFIVCFVWNILLKSTFDKLSKTPIKDKNNKQLDEAIDSDIDDLEEKQ